MTPLQFVSQLESVELENVFNPYSDQCEICDALNAHQNRANSLLKLLTAAEKIEVDMLWIGRDLGYRGGRRTGLAFTDDIHLADHGERWNLEFKRSTKGKVVKEMTAMFIWRVLNQLSSNIFLWNVFPLHPYLKNNSFSNRKHSREELSIGEEFLAELICLLKPRLLIPVGKDATATALRIHDRKRVKPVRHPSYGGSSIFQRQVLDICTSLKTK